MRKLLAVFIGSTITLIVLPCVIVHTDAAPSTKSTRIKIGSGSHRENGCTESYSAPFHIAIPNPAQLDHNYKGVLGGIERVYTEANGTRKDLDWAFTDNGSAVTFRLYARGGGTRIRNPFGGGGSVCQGASGANITVDVYAHYKPKT